MTVPSSRNCAASIVGLVPCRTRRPSRCSSKRRAEPRPLAVRLIRLALHSERKVAPDSTVKSPKGPAPKTPFSVLKERVKQATGEEVRSIFWSRVPERMRKERALMGAIRVSTCPGSGSKITAKRLWVVSALQLPFSTITRLTPLKVKLLLGELPIQFWLFKAPLGRPGAASVKAAKLPYMSRLLPLRFSFWPAPAPAWIKTLLTASLPSSLRLWV